MSKVFVVVNQKGLFANKHKEWTDGREPKLLFRSPHKDEAINLVFELSSKDIDLRAEAIEVDLNEKKQPVVEVTAELPVNDESIEDAPSVAEGPTKTPETQATIETSH